ncbi:MAG TPA: hypothetical protein DHV46_02085 [Desulfovibrio piger]|nr:hypothetical protein [Desulfovibrio piger]
MAARSCRPPLAARPGERRQGSLWAFIRIFLYRNSKSRAMAARLFTFRDQELAGGRPGVAHAVQPPGLRFPGQPGGGKAGTG